MEDYSYASRESVMAAPDIRASAYASAGVDSALVSAARQVDSLCHRGAYDRGIPGFLPWTGALSFDWPNDQGARSGRLWLDQFSLYSLTSMTSGGVTVSPASVLLEPSASGPPYSRIDLSRSTSAAFSTGPGAGQRSLALTGVWCPCLPQESAPSGFTVSGSPSSSATTLTANGPAFVGDILKVDSERMLVQEKTWVTSAQTGSLAASMAAETLAVSDGTVFRAGEDLLIDAERLLVRDVAGNNLIVRRAVGGSTLAAHTTATVYWPRLLTVKRGALGTTAAAHTTGTQIYRNVVPSLVAELAVAYALDTYFQQGAGYARTIGSGESERQMRSTAIKDLEERVYWAYGRRRSGAI